MAGSIDNVPAFDDEDNTYYAHSLSDKPKEFWQPLDKHLENVARLAEKFASVFGSGDWGRLAGLWHDLGKYSLAFQKYIRQADGSCAHLEGQPGRVDHSTAGAAHAARQFEKINPVTGRLLAYCIAGHHPGLTDWDTDKDSCLNRRLFKQKKETVDALNRVPNEILQQAPPHMPNITPSDKQIELFFQIAFFTRMVFSCLVDADFIDTENFIDQQKSSTRQQLSVSIGDMYDAIRRFLDQKQTDAPPTNVNSRRSEILKSCLAAAEKQPGFFSLTVPTGGGKTLSSLAFALKHAQKHNLVRVIYVVPFTSIIEQNANVFREALASLGDSIVLEHHSNLDTEKETPWSRLACENWDARLVVTTNVQFFESLFANRTSACRKLHNIANSVIVLDEAQMLPNEYLTPCLAAIKELVRNYNCSTVLCTATQPAIHSRDNFEIGIKKEDIREIVANPRQLYQAMKRVQCEHVGMLTDDELATRISETPAALCIVNTKKHAAALYERLKDENDGKYKLFHLSAAMCPEHRSKIIEEIKHRLKNSESCRLVSTQVVEAGVDIDFPVVYRAMAGLDSLAQAAGRCNREGNPKPGRFYIFDSQDPPPPGHLRQSAETGKELTDMFDDLLGLDAIEHYFRLYYWQSRDKWDYHDIMRNFRQAPVPLLDFRTAAEQFRLIPDNTKPVVIPWGKEGELLVEQLNADPFPDRTLRRKLQRYIVSLYERDWNRLSAAGLLNHACEMYPVLIDTNNYYSDTGVTLPDCPMIF